MILCFGEALLRFAPQPSGQWIEQSSMQTFIGGAELNVAFALAKWGVEVKYLTALPNNYMSDEIISYLQANQIDTSSILKSIGRMGNYILPMGHDFKNKGVIYDRSDTVFSNLNIDQIDLEQLFKNVTWFHLSAICPALNRNIANISLILLKEAKKRKIATSIDFNYRDKLWQYGTRPVEIMEEITKYCDTLMGNIWAVESLLGLPIDSQSIDIGDHLKASQTCINLLKEKYAHLNTIAFTYRYDQVKEPFYLATLYHKDILIESDHYKIGTILDKVGSGDCFMAALIYGMANNRLPKDIINLCVKAAIKKLAEQGDHTNTEIKDIF